MLIRLCTLTFSCLLLIGCVQSRPTAPSSGFSSGSTAIDALQEARSAGAAVQQVQDRQESMIQSIRP